MGKKTKDRMSNNSIYAMSKELEDTQHRQMLNLIDNSLWMQKTFFMIRFSIIPWSRRYTRPKDRKKIDFYLEIKTPNIFK